MYVPSLISIPFCTFQDMARIGIYSEKNDHYSPDKLWDGQSGDYMLSPLGSMINPDIRHLVQILSLITYSIILHHTVFVTPAIVMVPDLMAPTAQVGIKHLG